MLKRFTLLVGLSVLLSIFDVSAQTCCCNFNGTNYSLACNGTNQFLCGWVGGTWYNVTCTSLPIELVYFKAESKDTRVLLKWQTATETENDYFTIERSTDGVNWEIIDIIQGAGNSSLTQSYETWDNLPLPGLFYYRLKQTDFDGTFTYSEIVSIQIITGKPYLIHPNPATDHLIVSFDLSKEI